MMVVLALMLLMVMMVMAAAVGIITLVVIVMMVMMLVFGLGLQSHQLLLHGITTLGSAQDLFTVQLIPGRGDNDGGGVVLAQHGNAILNLILAQLLRMAEHDAAGAGNLVVEELTKILHIHLCLLGVNNGSKSTQHCPLGVRALHSTNDVRKLTDTRRLDQDAIGGKVTNYLGQRLTEVTNQRAADAAGVHLGDLHTCLAQKAAVDTDLSEFVLDEHQLLTAVGLAQKFFDQRGLTCAEKSRENINFGHFYFVLSVTNLSSIYFTPFSLKSQPFRGKNSKKSKFICKITKYSQFVHLVFIILWLYIG